MGTSRSGPAGAGTQTSALGFSGYIPGTGAVTTTEEWDATLASTKTITTS